MICTVSFASTPPSPALAAAASLFVKSSQCSEIRQFVAHRPRYNQYPAKFDGGTAAASTRFTPRSCYSATEAKQVTERVPPGCVRQFYEWNGHCCSYLECMHTSQISSSPPRPHVVLVHGFGGCALHYRRTIKAGVESGLRILAIDLLGFGASDKPVDVEYSIELWSSQLDDFCERFATQPVVFVGNSIGSLSVLHATKAMGETRVSAVVLMNTAGGLVSFRKSELSIVQRFMLNIFNGIFFNNFIGGLIFRWIRKRDILRSVLQQIYKNQNAVDDELIDTIGAPAFTPNAQQVFLQVLNADAGPKPEPLLASISSWCPVFCVWGEQDTLTPLRTGMHPGIQLSKYHDNFTLHTIDNCGHCPFDDQPEQVNALVLPFLIEHTLRVIEKSQVGDRTIS